MTSSSKQLNHPQLFSVSSTANYVNAQVFYNLINNCIRVPEGYKHLTTVRTCIFGFGSCSSYGYSTNKLKSLLLEGFFTLVSTTFEHNMYCDLFTVCSTLCRPLPPISSSYSNHIIQQLQRVANENAFLAVAEVFDVVSIQS